MIGDGLNDILMFANAGLSIAMGNAIPEVQRMARYVTKSNEEDGFANAVDQIILGQERKPEEKLGLPPLTRACLFDLDGVLTKTAKLHAAAWKQMFDDFLRQWSTQSGKAFVPFDAVHDYQLYVDGKLRDRRRPLVPCKPRHPVNGGKDFGTGRRQRHDDASIASAGTR